MDGPIGLRDALLKHQDMVLRNFTENLMTYALGRRLEYTDMPAVRAIVNGAAAQDNQLSAFVLGVVNAPDVPHERGGSGRSRAARHDRRAAAAVDRQTATGSWQT